MKVIIYTRVSTDDKDQNPESQLLKCRNYCSLHEHKIVEELTDNGISGDTYIFSRPSGTKVKELIEQGKAEGLVVFSVDRYSRENPIQVMQQLNHLKDQGITFISVSEPVFNMESEFAEPMKYMLTWFSNYFLVQHKKKVISGMERAKLKGTKSGKPIGRPKVQVNKFKVKQLSNQGLSQREIAKQFEISLASVNRLINN